MLEMLAGGALVAAGYLIGRYMPGRRRTPKPPQPICGCGHELAYHDPERGVCRAGVYVESEWDHNGEARTR